jgi:hypothetical protein
MAAALKATATQDARLTLSVLRASPTRQCYSIMVYVSHEDTEFGMAGIADQCTTVDRPKPWVW